MRKSKYSLLYNEMNKNSYFILPIKAKRCFGDYFNFKVEFIKVDKSTKQVDNAGFCTFRYTGTFESLKESILDYIIKDKCKMIDDYMYEDLYPNIFNF